MLVGLEELAAVEEVVVVMQVLVMVLLLAQVEQAGHQQLMVPKAKVFQKQLH